MIERQDIDALLVSALYGELTPADEAKLATHLESHPADRSALDDLKVARQAIRESRIFELQLDPPQAVSALLLQEAARRAPRRVVVDDTKRETWFGRFVRSFVAHPAMAAAATLVLVVGVAGTLYLKKGNDQFAEQTTDQRVANGETAPAHEVAPTVAAGPAQGSAATATAGDDGVTVALRDEDTRNTKTEGDGKDTFKANEGKAKAGETKNTATGGDNLRRSDSSLDKRERSKPAVAHQSVASNFDHGSAPKPVPQKGGYLEMHSPDPTPKDMDSAPRGAKAEPSTETGYGNSNNGVVVGGVVTPTAPGAGGSTTAAAPRNQPVAPPPAPPALTSVDKPQAVADKKAATKEDQSNTWARDTHQRLLGLVKAGKCQDAAPLAVQIKNKAPDYYNSYVVNDRGLKQCMAYISDAAERDAEKSQKSRPAKRVEATDSVK